MVAQTFWLENSFFRFKQENNFASGAVSWSPISGAVLIALAAVIVFFNQYLVKRLLDRTHPPTQPVESLPEEISANEKNT
jgi:hypothetical protein